jgi:hypothetical protein
MVLRFELGEGSPPRGGAEGPFCWGAAEVAEENHRPRFSTAPHNPSPKWAAPLREDPR